MRRTLERQHFPVSDVGRGEVVVATSFTHPTRGLVRCPAAPVAHTAMLATGLRVRRKPVAAGSGDAVLHTVSYVDSRGQVVGLGVAAHPDESQAMTLAADVVRQWAAVMRTRRVTLEATGPSCGGLRWPWGVGRPTRAVGLTDAPCPLLARATATARRFADEHAAVVIIGGAGQSVAAQVPGSTVVTSVAEIDTLAIDRSALVAFVVSPGLPVEDAGVLAARLRNRFPKTIGQHPDEFCYAASDRRATVHAVAACSELTLVLGDSADLVATATAAGSRVEQLDDVGMLRPEWLLPVASVGILVGGSVRPSLASELVEVLSGLGPLSVARRRVTTEIASAIATPARRAG